LIGLVREKLQKKAKTRPTHPIGFLRGEKKIHHSFIRDKFYRSHFKNLILKKKPKGGRGTKKKLAAC